MLIMPTAEGYNRVFRCDDPYHIYMYLPSRGKFRWLLIVQVIWNTDMWYTTLSMQYYNRLYHGSFKLSNQISPFWVN